MFSEFSDCSSIFSSILTSSIHVLLSFGIFWLPLLDIDVFEPIESEWKLAWILFCSVFGSSTVYHCNI
jgi:hypothetical protein